MPIGNFGAPQSALILLSGLPGAGKTTFAHALAKVMSFEHVESDAIRRGLAPRPRYTPAESARVFDRAERVAAGALAVRRHALIDATNLSLGDRKRFVRLANRTGATLIAVRVIAPDATIRARLASPIRPGFSQATVQVYEMMKDRARPFSTPAVVVDTRFPLEPSIDLVLRLLPG
ncbi:MAG: ATP-binding protein [Tepidiformaceae bacterium]